MDFASNVDIGLCTGEQSLPDGKGKIGTKVERHRLIQAQAGMWSAPRLRELDLGD